jgi:thermostable 8-oxoguanine DNA glycosylase
LTAYRKATIFSSQAQTFAEISFFILFAQERASLAMRARILLVSGNLTNFAL